MSGEPALPTHGDLVLLPISHLRRHLLICGATGSGKSETAMRLAYTLARTTDAAVFYLDGKGDRGAARRFSGLMTRANRRAKVFPHEPFDGWRGSAAQLEARLMEVIDYASEGPAAWYRDVARTAIALACQHPDGPPRSREDFLERLELRALARAHGRTGAIRTLSAQQISQVRLRYEAFFAQVHGLLDGDWAWEDTNAAYVMLDSLALGDQTRALARFLLEDFAAYFSRRKAAEQLCVMIVDEFSALASRGGMAQRLEQARGFQTGFVLVPQTVAGLGGEGEAARLLGSVGTIVCHQVNTPEEVTDLAGTQRVPVSTRSTTAMRPEPGRRGRPQRYGRLTTVAELGGCFRAPSEPARVSITDSCRDEPKVDPNDVRALPVGEAFVISAGRAMRVQVLPAPNASAELPEPDERPLADCQGGQAAASRPARPDVPY